MKPGNLRDNVRCQHLQTRKGLDDEGETEYRQNSRKHVSMRPFLVKGRFFVKGQGVRPTHLTGTVKRSGANVNLVRSRFIPSLFAKRVFLEPPGRSTESH